MKTATLQRLIEVLDIDELKQFVDTPIWTPFSDKPQEIAYYSLADELYYGGAAGGGKSDLLLGVALTQYYQAIIYRRDSKQCQHLEERMLEILNLAGYREGKDYRYNSVKMVLRTKGGRRLSFGGVPHIKDLKKFQGRPRDFVGFDESTEFTQHMYKFLTGWLRTDRVSHRTRIICASNPPADVDGRWVVNYWAPWLDPKHKNPAKPGELRWFVVTSKGEEIEVPNGAPVVFHGETLKPKSRTFVPAKVDDNPIYVKTGYKAQLQTYQEPLRSLYLLGDFRASIKDDPWQVIPTAWVEEAMARWETTPRPDVPCSCVGVDVARGGVDNTVIAVRWDNWVDTLRVIPGAKTPDGGSVVALLVPLLHDNRTTVAIDAIGIGASVVDYMRDLGSGNSDAEQEGFNVSALNAACKSTARDKTGRFGFVNQRAQWYWQMRERLDPNSGEDICLPPDRELLQELTAPRYSITSVGIKVEPKEGSISASGVRTAGIRERLGRSPDKADAVVYCFTAGETRPEMYFALDELETYNSPWQMN